MKTQIACWTFFFVLGAASAWAGIGDALPPNSCPSGNKLKTKLAVLDVTADGGTPCTTKADTAITCTVKKPDSTGVTADFIVEFFDELTGLAMTPGGGVSACAVAAGNSVTFATNATMPKAWSGGVHVTAPGGTCGANCFLHGSARILSTGKIQCTATRVDLTQHCVSLFPLIPLATKDLTVIKIPRQKGD